ncbi:GPCR family 3 C-terminal protein [Trinorchestia longiramus]|nr:GPCR family 3 C-terminal protein [Trinorchestia longiramus]
MKFAKFSSSPLESPRSSILWPVLQEYCQIISEQGSEDGRTRLMAVDATHSAAALRAVSTLAAAFRMVQLDHCPQQVNCTEIFNKTVHQEVVDKLGALSFDVQDGADRLRFTVDARLSTAYSVVTVVSETVVQIGHYLENSGMQWTEVPESLSPPQHKQKEQLTGYRPRLSKPLVSRRPLHTVHHLQEGNWRTTTWSVIICVAAAAGVVCCFLVAAYTAIRTCDGTLSNTEVPGILVLVGTSLVFVGSVITVVPAPTQDLAVVCCVQHVLPYVATALTYAALLTKALHVLVLNAMRLHSKIPPAVLYLPLTALVALAMLVAALGDATTLHFILPNEVASLPTYNENSGNNHSVTGTDENGVTSGAQFAKDVREEDAYEFTRVQVCKRPDQIPAVMGFAYLIVMLIVTLIILCSTKSTNKETKGFHECRRMIALCCVSMPLVLLWAIVSLYAPLHLQQHLSALSLLLVAYVVLSLILIPQLYRISSRKVNQFSHKPLSGGTSPISTVFKSHATATHNFTYPVVAYVNRGNEDRCRFSDIYLDRDLDEKEHNTSWANWKIMQFPRTNKYATSWNPMNGLKMPRHEGYPKIPQQCANPTIEAPTRSKPTMETFR